MSDQASGYRYVLPGAWVHLDPHPARRAASVRRAIVQGVRRDQALAAHRARLRELLLRSCELAAASGVERVSLLAERVGDRVMAASATFGVQWLPVVQPMDASALRAGVVDDPAVSVEVVTLPQVTAVRRTRLDESLLGPEGPIAMRQWQLIVPWPGSPRVGLLTMSSPCRPLWPQLAQTFDACGQSFRWTWPTVAEQPG